MNQTALLQFQYKFISNEMKKLSVMASVYFAPSTELNLNTSAPVPRISVSFPAKPDHLSAVDVHENDSVS